MGIVKKIIQGNYLKKSVVYFLIYCLILNTWLPVISATPSGGVFTVGAGTIVDGVPNSTVTVNQAQSVIEWGSPGSGGIDTSSGESLTFLQQGGLSNSAVLNRIMSGNPTQFDGTLGAQDMRIFIVNPAGVVFGAGSSVNVNQLIASSLDISNINFLSGNYEFIAGDGIGSVANYGSINAVDGVALIGKHVRNNGTITAGEGGFIVMAAGDRVLLGEPGSSIIVEMDSVTISEEGDGDVVNEGDIEAPAGIVVLAAGDIFSSAMELPKVASGIGTVEQNGTINADGTGGDGGGIALTAADEVVLTTGSETTANAGTNGDAGLVIVHSRGWTAVRTGALIEAMGGHVPNNAVDDVVDTAVEISGHQINLAGDIDASATNGKRGKVVIDAFDIFVADGSVPVDPPDNTVYEKWIEQQSQSATDVELVANSAVDGDIVVGYISDGAITGDSGGIILRTKYNTGGILFESDQTAIHTTEGGNVYMLAGAGGITTGDITTDISSGGAEPGKIKLYTNNDGDITTGKLKASGGSSAEVTAVASGDLTINDNVETITNQLGQEKNYGQAKTYLQAVSGDVEIDGMVQTRAYGKYSTTAEIVISAGQDVIVNPGQNRIEAISHTTSYCKPSNASVSIFAGGEFVRDTGGEATVHVYAKSGIFCSVAEVYSTDSEDEWNEYSCFVHASLEIEDNGSGDAPEPPEPPYIPPIVPEPPMGQNDQLTTHMGDPTGGNVLENDDPGLTVESYTQPGHGTVTVAANGDYTYTPTEAGYVGEDSFTYVATNGVLDSEPVMVTVTITNTLPQAGDDSIETHMDTVVSDNVLGNDFDPDGDSLEVVLDGLSPQHGELTLNPDGSFTYTPDTGYVGDDSFAYAVTDGQLDGGNPVTVTGTATITIGNDLPTSVQDTAETNQGVPVTINVLANDTDNNEEDVLSVVTDGAAPEHGELVLNEDNTFTYTPEPSFVGEDDFVYAASDGQFGAELIWVTVTIKVNASALIAAAPLPEEVEFIISGCPALIEWTAEELGMDGQMAQVWIAGTLASSSDIQPCDACANLKSAAAVLQDADGTHIAALAQVINEFVSSAAPPSEEQMASIADAIANKSEEGNAYALAGEYIDAIVAYVGIMEDLGYSPEDSITVVSDKYVAPLIERGNTTLAVYVAVRLTSLGS